MSDWRPIETAPKDGTIVDLWIQIPEIGDGYRVTDAEWRKGEWQINECGEFDSEIRLRRMDGQNFATHWMPLPDPPTI